MQRLLGSISRSHLELCTQGTLSLGPKVIALKVIVGVEAQKYFGQIDCFFRKTDMLG